jgi:uncharacterized membrane protein YbhN (UPF0104 family)
VASTAQRSSDEGPENQLNAAKARRSLRNGLISLVLLIGLVVGLLEAIPDLNDVADAIDHMNPTWVAVGVVLEILSCLGYVFAFLQVFDRAPLRFGARVALSELAFGAAVSLGGAGSLAVGAWLLVDRGAPATRVAERSAVLFLYTSAINVITLALAGLALLVGLVPGPSSLVLSLAPAVVGVAALLFFLMLPPLTDRLAAARGPGRLQTLLRQTAATVRETARLLRTPDWRMLGVIGYLWFDIGVLVACFAAIGRVPPLAALVLAYQIGYLSNFVPVPGGIGVLDGSLVGMLVLYGVNGTDAAAATLVYHAIALWVPAMWGTIAFLVLQRSRGEPLTLRAPRAERRRMRRERRAGAAPEPQPEDRG